MKEILTYYIASGLIVMLYSQVYYDRVKRYHNIEYVDKNLFLFLQFLLGFVTFPFFIYSYIRDKYYTIRSGSIAIVDELDNESPTEDMLRAMEEDLENRIRSVLKRYHDCIETYGNDLEAEYIPLFGEHKEKTSQIIYNIIAGMEYYSRQHNGRIDETHILEREGYFITLKKDRARLMKGWNTICIVKNINE